MKLTTVVLLLLAAGICNAAPSSLIVDGHTLALVDDPQASACGIVVYRSSTTESALPKYELGITRTKDASFVWKDSRESLLRVLKKKEMVLPLIVRSSNDDTHVLVDYAYKRSGSGPDLIEYVILTHYLAANGDILSVDLRIRMPVDPNVPTSAFAGVRDRLVREFILIHESLKI